MTEWDNLWLNENEPRSWMGYVNDTAWILKVKAVGDKLQAMYKHQKRLAEGNASNIMGLQELVKRDRQKLEAIREWFVMKAPPVIEGSLWDELGTLLGVLGE